MNHIASKINNKNLIEIKFSESLYSKEEKEIINNDIFKDIRNELLHINFWDNLKNK